MNVQIVGKHMDLGETLQGSCREALDHLVEKFDVVPTHCWVTFSKKEHHQFESQISLSLRGVHIRSHGQADQPYVSFDLALARAREKIARYKDRLDDHHKHRDNHNYQKLSAIDSLLAANWADAPLGQEPQVVEEKLQDVPVLRVADAALQLELSDAGAVVFRNKGTGRTNVLYRRSDGQLAWVDLR